MIDSAPLSWSPIDWDDPCGGTIRLWPFLPNVVLTNALRRSTGEWDGLAFLLPDDESEIWDEQYEQEKASPGINRDSIAASGGTLARMMIGMSSIESIRECWRVILIPNSISIFIYKRFSYIILSVIIIVSIDFI